MKKIVAGVGLTLATLSFARAAIMPFWGEGSPSTNRAPSQVWTVPIETFSSQDFTVRIQSIPEFSSEKLGALIIIR